jgi:hypothetical protein
MQITINLPPDLEQDLIRQASQANISLQTLIFASFTPGGSTHCCRHVPVARHRLVLRRHPRIPRI